MKNEHDQMRLSQLADGELPSDQANELLLEVLDDSADREALKGLLRLRRATAEARVRSPQPPIVAISGPLRSARQFQGGWRVGRLAAAACVGGLLVLAGFWAAGHLGNSGRDENLHRIVSGPVDGKLRLVSVDEMQQVANVFALHESVAGPLAWYAADDQNIRFASAGAGDVVQSPIGVLIKLQSAVAGAPERTLVIVCRNDQAATIELPAESGHRSGLRLYLAPRTVNGKIDIRYAIAMDGQSRQGPSASVTGQRSLGLSEESLGQVAMGDSVLKIEAAAWPMQQEHK